MSRKIIPISNPSEMTKEDIIKHFYNENGKILSSRTSETYLKNHNLYDLIMNYYSDSLSVKETLFRIYNGIDERPVCKECGSPVRFWGNCEDGTKPAHFSTYCSNACAMKRIGERKSPAYSKIFSYKKEDITVELLQSYGYITESGIFDMNMFNVRKLRSHGLYNALVELFDDENIDNRLNEYSKAAQMINKIATGEFVKCKSCDNLVLFQNKRFLDNCSHACYGKLLSHRYDEKHGIKRTIDGIFPDEVLLEDKNIYEKYKDASEEDLLKYMKENKSYVVDDNDMRGKRPQMSMRNYWLQHGLDIKIVWDHDENGNIIRLIKVRNCCPIHGDCIFTESQFNNRVRRRKHSPMCPICNQFGKNNKMTSPELNVRNILDSFNLNYEYENKTVAAPYDCDFYIPSLKIGFEVNGVQWHSGIKNYLRHKHKILCAKKNDVDIYYIWEDDINQNTDDVYEYIKSIIENPHDRSKHYVIHPEDEYCDYFFVNTHNNRRVYFKNEIEEKALSNWKCCFVIK